MSLSNKAKHYIRKHHAKKSTSSIADDLNLDKTEVQEFIDEISKPLPLKKKITFYAITLSIPILFFVILEVTLRSVGYMGNTELFVDPKIPTNEYLIPNQNFASRYFFYTKTIPSPSVDVFLKEKPENAYRIFAMGGSSAAGYPYGYNGTFSRLVDDILTDAMPSREVEVVNVATSAISTYTLYDQVDEILEQQPDAIMIYAGHNEFYGALGVGSNETLGGFPGFVRFYLKLQRFKTFMFLREMIVDAGQWMFGDSSIGSGTLMKRIINDQAIELDGPKYELALLQFRSNMEAIISTFDEQDIPVYLSTIASNVKDQPPFVSVEQEQHPAANKVYEEATNHYQKGELEEAQEDFEYAKDLDGLKFRAPTAINKIIVELAKKYKNVHLVDTHDTFEQQSTDGIVGSELMLEHLHPNQSGYFLMGRSFAEAMLSDFSTSGMIEKEPENFEPYFEQMYITDFDSGVVHHRLRTLKQGFPFVLDDNITPYQFKYNPTSFVDSLSFAVVHQKKRWDAAKVEVAQYYQNHGESEKALQEYYGLIRNQPWNDSPYVYAARVFLSQNDFTNAEPLLMKAYELSPKEAFVTKMLGSIKLNKKETKAAIKFLEESRSLNPNDPQMLYNLSGAYGTNQEFQKAIEVANEVIELNPNYPGIQQWKAQLTRILNSKRN